ncbi:MAG: hypothetical protein HYR55_18235 [Acidobacteria bacterium]|nr:hypothetical protein [Acidobacteriota bacterium]MBI3657384.1 hypothetical protein [Acidobacteriota bacterium]
MIDPQFVIINNLFSLKGDTQDALSPLTRRFLRALLGLLVGLSFCEIIVPQNLPPATEAEVRLRARVDSYWSYMQKGTYSKAIDLVRPDSRDFFLSIVKSPVHSYQINRISFEKEPTLASVLVSIKKTVVRIPQPVELKVVNKWQWVNGDWFVFFHRSEPLPFGGPSPEGKILGPNSLSLQGNKVPPSKPPAQAPPEKALYIDDDDTGKVPLQAAFNFERTFSGDVISYSFKFINSGTKLVKFPPKLVTGETISAVILGSDGKETTKREFAQNQGAEIKVRFDTKNLEGLVAQQADIFLTDRKRSLSVSFKGIVENNFQVQPAQVDLAAREKSLAKVTIENRTAFFVILKEVKQIPPFLAATLSKDTLGPNDFANLTIAIKPQAKIPAQGYEGVISILTNLERQPIINVPVRLPTTLSPKKSK